VDLTYGRSLFEFQARVEVRSGFQVGRHHPVVEVEVYLEKNNHRHSFPKELDKVADTFLRETARFLVLCPFQREIHLFLERIFFSRNAFSSSAEISFTFYFPSILRLVSRPLNDISQKRYIGST
jgi:hypothetical protein